MDGYDGQSLKGRVASTIKWNVVDRVASQLLYAVTGVILARMLSREAFGLVGAILVFQAFALMLVDSGFSSALIQRKEPEDGDYSTVFWFNMLLSGVLYALLWLLAPWISSLFGHAAALVELARVMFVSIPLYALGIVQANRMMKRLDVRMIALANSLSLVAGAVVGIALALEGCGAWAIVWQTVTLTGVKSLTLWLAGGWHPKACFSWWRLRGFFRVGAGVMVTNFFNTVFQNITAFLVGNRVGLVPLGYYTQSDKWSKMGVMSLSQVLTTSFLPSLSAVQDSPERFGRQTAKMNRLTAYLTMPAMGMLAVMAPGIFHCLFGTKWDASVPLFQLLLARGALLVPTMVYTQFILARGCAGMLVKVEVVRDVLAAVAIVVCLPTLAVATPDNPVQGLEWFLVGQLVATVVAWVYTLIVAAGVTPGRNAGAFLRDALPYVALTAVTMAVMWGTGLLCSNPWLQTAFQGLAGAVVYLGINRIAGSVIQQDVFAAITKRKNL